MAHRKLIEFEKMRAQRMLILLVLVSFVIGFGTFALHYTEGWSLFEAFFFTLITVSTVGYSIPDGISTTSKVVISLLIASGISIVLYALTSLTSLVVEGHFQDYVRKRRIRRMIDNMKDHIIVVGAGRTGRHTVFQIKAANRPFVVVDASAEAIESLITIMGEEIPYVVGDATEEETLISAGIKKARTLIVTLPDDTKNTFVVLTARSLNPSLEIITRASDQKAYNKLSYAGADKVIVTSQATGQKLAQMALNPSAVKFLDMFSFGGTPIRVEEIFIPAGCVLAGKTLANLNLPRRIGILVIGITRHGQTIFNPTADTQILAGDTLLVMGKEEGFKNLHELIESHE